jgi:hypothetical protein
VRWHFCGFKVKAPVLWRFFEPLAEAYGLEQARDSKNPRFDLPEGCSSVSGLPNGTSRSNIAK